MNAPRVQIDGTAIAALLAALALAGVALYVYSKRQQIGQALNVTSDKNLAYSGVNAVGAAVSGNKNFSLGGAIYDLFHPGQNADINSPVILSSPADAVAAGTAPL